MSLSEEDVKALEAEIASTIDGAGDLNALEQVRIDALGKKGRVTSLMKNLGGMSADEKKVFGPLLNQIKNRIASSIDARKSSLEGDALNARLADERIDVTLPAYSEEEGRIHPVSQVMDEIAEIFADLGFSVAEGPDVEDDFHNFTALNIPPEHPARQMHDTFYLPEDENGDRKVLRTHTSPVQIRTMQNNEPPLRVIAPGRTYRSDSDATHTPMFHQVEGLVIDEDTHMGHLKGTLEAFVKAFFEVDNVKMRFRPSYFPFTEPSAEVDIGCSFKGGELRIGEGDDWLEILGCGMVNPKVLEHCGLDSERYQGFAFGCGIDRLAMLKYGMTDLRPFFDADLRWMRHYGFLPLDIPTIAGGAKPMKFTLSWLKEYLELDASLDALSERLTALGLEVEKITNMGEQLAAFKVAHVISAEQHPDADRLRVCKVDTGDGIVQVVCGAPNARTGMKGVFAPSGTHIPGTGIDLKPTKIRGIESSGMLCSERELMLSDEHDGIIDLDTDAPAGTPYADLAGLDDPVIEIAITPNRQDCLGVAGIARDLAASGFGTLKADDIAVIPGHYKNPIDITLKFDGDDNSPCPLFVGRYIRGLKNGPSPKWLQDKLKAIGLRPISALVDITNLVTYDRGRPLHVFDAAKVSGTLHARIAEKGESLLALDGKTYQMNGEECVIADDNGVLGFGGVIGGELSGCSEDTTDVLVEAALFDPIRTAMTGRVHGIESDARYRFERGVDVNFVIPGIELATKLIMDLCGGEPSEITIAGEVPIFDKVVSFDTGRVASLGGVTLAEDEIIAILERLGFNAKDQNGATWQVSVPSWRTDIVGPADLVEEVLRIHGYDNIPVASLPRLTDVAQPTLTTAQRRSRATRRALASRGFNECVTWSFISEDQTKRFGGINEALRLANPISSELVIMRPSLLPNLLDAAKRNIDRSMDLIRLFEVGPQYQDDTPDGQGLVASGLRVGDAGPAHWATSARDVNAFDAKADAMAALAAAGAPAGNLRVFDGAPDWYHPGRSGTLRLNPKMVLANFGELHPAILKELDIDGPVVAFEVFMDNLPPSRKSTATKPAAKMNDLQPVVRDFAFVVGSDTAAADLMQAARGADKKHIKDVSLFDVFDGKGMEPGTKSLAIAVRLEPLGATFTDDDLDGISGKIVTAVEKATGGTLRG